MIEWIELSLLSGKINDANARRELDRGDFVYLKFSYFIRDFRFDLNRPVWNFILRIFVIINIWRNWSATFLVIFFRSFNVSIDRYFFHLPHYLHYYSLEWHSIHTQFCCLFIFFFFRKFFCKLWDFLICFCFGQWAV